MKIEYTTRFNVGDKLYYLSGMEIKETYIKGIHLSFEIGKINYSVHPPKLVYHIADSHKPCIGDEAVLGRYYLSKADILKKIADQL